MGRWVGWNADLVIDLGPDGGDKGGEIVAVGTPEAVAKVERSFTGGICGGCWDELPFSPTSKLVQDDWNRVVQGIAEAVELLKKFAVSESSHLTDPHWPDPPLAL